MPKTIKIGWMIAISLSFVSLAQAQNTATSSGLLLERTSSVRAEGMGGAQAAVATDEAGALSWNPANIYGDAYYGVSAVYFRGLMDDNFGLLHADMAYGPDLAFGASLGFYDGGSMELNLGNDSTNVNAQRDYLAAVTGAYHLGVLNQDLAVGANLKFLQSTLLAKYSAFAAAADLGARLDLTGLPLHVGLALKNLGTPIKYLDSADPLPAYTLLGAAYDVFQSPTLGVLAAGDVQWDLDKKMRSNLGAEVQLNDLFAFRTGYQFNDDVSYLTVGFGVHYENFQIDYAFAPTQDMNFLHSASLRYILGTPPLKNQAAAGAPAEPNYLPENVEPANLGATQKVRVEILEVRKTGGRVSSLVLNIGASQGVQSGMRGIVVDNAGAMLATFRIHQVEPKLCLADLIGLSREITRNAMAAIDVPLNGEQQQQPAQDQNQPPAQNQQQPSGQQQDQPPAQPQNQQNQESNPTPVQQQNQNTNQ